MNKARRENILKLSKSVNSLKESIESCQNSLVLHAHNLESISNQEDEYRDNMPENLQGSMRYYDSEEASEHLNEAINLIEESNTKIKEVIEELDNVVCELNSI